MKPRFLKSNEMLLRDLRHAATAILLITFSVCGLVISWSYAYFLWNQ
jgi:hypothetical protein